MASAQHGGRPAGGERSLAGRYALVTGSTQGLGAATARAFAERGAAGVVVTGRNPERGEAVAGELAGLGCDARFVAGDLACLDDCRNLVEAADRAFGTLHILVNAGALTERATIWDTTPEFYEQVMNINVRAPFFLTQAAVKVMQREGVAGSIVNVSSVAAHGGEPMLCPYAISKAALNAMTKNVAYSVMRQRIRVNALNLGWMNTPGEDVIQRRYHSDGGGLAGRRRGRAAVRSADQTGRGRPHHRLSGLRRVRRDDRGADRLRPVGVRRRPPAHPAPDGRMAGGGR